MSADTESEIEHLREQFDVFPYPGRPAVARHDPRQLYYHSVQSACWRVWGRSHDGRDLKILDAGCGSGSTTLLLAAANPGAQVTGVDLSEKSIEMARRNAEAAGASHVRFETRSLTAGNPDGEKYDYINADEILYLVPDPARMVGALAAMLKPGGILRGNFHCAYQRAGQLRLQAFFSHLGFMEGEMSEERVNMVREVLASLKPDLPVLARHPNLARKSSQSLMSNPLLRGDKGFTFPQVFDILKAANLRLASMLDWVWWDFDLLFKDENTMESSIVDRLESLSFEERLTMMQLLCGQKRLLDFWAADTEGPRPEPALELAAVRHLPVSLHPVAHRCGLRERLKESVSKHRCVFLGACWPVRATQPLVLEPVAAAMILRLFQQPQTVGDLVESFNAARLALTGRRDEAGPALEVIGSMEMIGMLLVQRR